MIDFKRGNLSCLGWPNRVRSCYRQCDTANDIIIVSYPLPFLVVNTQRDLSTSSRPTEAV